MKVIIVGASGRIGSKVAEKLSAHHEVIRVGARRGDLLCDYTDPVSVRGLFEKTGTFDALIAVAGGERLRLAESVWERFQTRLTAVGTQRKSGLMPVKS